MVRIALLLALMLAGGCATPERGAEDVFVFAAASLAAPLEALRDSFEVENPGVRVHLNVASSATLARQIDAGAPFDVFFSADPQWVAYLRDRGLVGADVWQEIGNELVAVRSPHARIASLAEARHVSTGDGASVPLGQYAKRALRCEGMWEDLQHRLVGMVDAGAAAEAVRSGAADGGILYESDVLRTGLDRLPDIGPACQPEIRYAGAEATVRKPGAARYFAYVRRAHTVWQSYGFRVYARG